MAESRICLVEGCNKPQYTLRGYCENHLRRLQLYGDPLKGRISPGGPERFLKEVAATYEGDDCLLWPYAKTYYGYGELTVNRRKRLAHRLLCEIVHGPPPSSGEPYDAAHSCGVRLCVNPRHIRFATRAANEADKVTHGRSNRGERHGLSKLKTDQVRTIKQLLGTMKPSAIAERFGVNVATIDAIRRGKRWRHV